MPKVLVRAAFGYDADAVSDENGLECRDVSLTDQSQRDDADINVLVKRFGLTGEVPILERVPLDEDFVGITDYKSAMDALFEADNQFMELPADIRARFNHNAGDFVKFCSDDKNRPELEKLGLLKAPPPPPPLTAEAIAAALKPSERDAK